MNQKGFTLIEMLIVLLVISVLLIITVPNVIQHQKSVQNKGCEAFVKMVQAQVQSYLIDNNELPSSVSVLQDGEYIENTTCPNGSEVELDSDGKVKIVGS